MAFGPSLHERGRDQGRGDERPVASGRGGAGNMVRSPSRGRPAEERGETAAQQAYASEQKIVSSGRGGAGNLRSPSRGPADRGKAAELDRQEHEIQKAALKHDEHAAHATGRGGAGNVKRDHSQEGAGRGREGGVGSAIRSLSRSRSRDARSASRPREGAGGATLPAVDESGRASTSTKGTHVDGDGASTTNASTTTGSKGGLLGKITQHLPGHHKS